MRLDEREAARYGIHGVPYFVINGKLAISGAEATDTLMIALAKAAKEETVRSAQGMTCGPDGCKVG